MPRRQSGDPAVCEETGGFYAATRHNKTENRMQFAQNVLDFVHAVPWCKTATTVGARDIQRLGDRLDVRIHAYEDYTRKKVLQ